MKLYILNSAVMPQDGTYSRKLLNLKETINLLKSATEIVSSVGYKEVSDLLTTISGVTVPLDVDKRVTVLEEDECTILACKLKFREKSDRKGINRHVNINEYEFVLINYTK